MRHWGHALFRASRFPTIICPAVRVLKQTKASAESVGPPPANVKLRHLSYEALRLQPKSMFGG